jgi:hypothetical protein
LSRCFRVFDEAIASLALSKLLRQRGPATEGS